MIASTGNTCIQRLGISRTSQPMIHAASNRPEENMRMGVQRPHRWSSIGSPTSEGGGASMRLFRDCVKKEAHLAVAGRDETPQEGR